MQSKDIREQLRHGHIASPFAVVSQNTSAAANSVSGPDPPWSWSSHQLCASS